MLEHVNRAQRAILSVHECGSTEAWARGVSEALSTVMGTDKIYFIEPEEAVGHGQMPQDRLAVHSPSMGVQFAAGISSHFKGFDDDGFSLFREDYASLLHRLVRMGGAGAFHDAPLYDRQVRESMELHQDVFDPVGVQRQMAISVPRVRGEAMLIAGFEHRHFPEHDEDRHLLMQLLAPAFEAAMHTRARLKSLHYEAIEAVAGHEPFAAVSLDGALAYLSDGLRGVLADSLDAPVIIEAVLSMAQNVSLSMLKENHDAPAWPMRQLGIGNVEYVIRARIVTAPSGDPEVHVSVNTAAGAQIRHDIATDFGLTPREREVAQLIAEGLRDKEIARRLSISPHTARRHSESLLRKTGLSNRAGIARLLFRSL